MKMSGIDKDLTGEKLYNSEITGRMLLVDKLPDVTDRIFCVPNYPGQHIGDYDMYIFQAVKIGEAKTDTYCEAGKIKCSSYVELEDEEDEEDE